MFFHLKIICTIVFAHEWSLGEMLLTNETLTGSVENSRWSSGGAVASLVQQGVYEFIHNRRQGLHSVFLDSSWKSRLYVSHALAATFQLCS